PEKGELDMTLPVAAGEPAANPRWQAHIERARNMLPVALSGWQYEAAIVGKSLVLRFLPPAGQQVPATATFFPERELLIEPAAPEKVVHEGRALRIEMKLAEPVLTDVKAVRGVAVSESGWPGLQRKAIAVNAPL